MVSYLRTSRKFSGHIFHVSSSRGDHSSWNNALYYAPVFRVGDIIHILSMTDSPHNGCFDWFLTLGKSSETFCMGGPNTAVFPESSFMWVLLGQPRIPQRKDQLSAKISKRAHPPILSNFVLIKRGTDEQCLQEKINCNVPTYKSPYLFSLLKLKAFSLWIQSTTSNLI